MLETGVGPALTTVDGGFQGVGRRPTGSQLELTVAGRAGVPTNASAVMLNVTVVSPSGPGSLSAFLCNGRPTGTSSLNFAAGQVVANAGSCTGGLRRERCIATSAETDLVVDVVGYVPDPLSLVTAYQMRLLDTRGGGPRDGTFDGRFLGTGRLAAGATLELTVGGRAVIADAAGVLLNVTVVGPSTAGFLTVFPCGQTRPRASNLNYRAGTIVANAVLVSLGTGGNVCLYSSAETDLVVDLSAHTAPTNSLTTVVPARLAETRAGPGGTIDDLFAGIGARPAGSTLELAVTGRAGVPAGAHAVVLNPDLAFASRPPWSRAVSAQADRFRKTPGQPVLTHERSGLT